MIWDRGFGGSNVADFWARPSYKYILLDLLLEEISKIMGPPCRPAKILQKWEISLKNWKKCLFLILGGQNRLPVEVPDVFLVCHEVLLLTNMDHPRKKFLTRRTSFLPKINNRTCQFLNFFRQKNLIFEVVAEISGNMMRTIYPRNVRRRGFSKFHASFVEL